MKTSVTIADVSKKAGVSKSTVSNYLNGKYERMSDETKKIISDTIRELGYTPNLSARRLPNRPVPLHTEINRQHEKDF